MRCDHKYEKLSNPYVESRAYSGDIAKQQGGVYCDIDDTLCDEKCNNHKETAKEQK